MPKAPNWLGRLLRFGQAASRPRRSRNLLKAPPRTWNARLGYSFARPELLSIALTHPSAAVGSDVHYERLEFLGDAVLDLAIADMLMRRFPEAKEGPLSKQRASIVNGRTLALKAQSIELGERLELGKGEEKSGGRDKISILAAAFEAVVGAIYTDGGLAPAQRVVESLFVDDIGGPPPSATTRPSCRKSRIVAIARNRFTNWWRRAVPTMRNGLPPASVSRARSWAPAKAAARNRVSRPRHAPRWHR